MRAPLLAWLTLAVGACQPLQSSDLPVAGRSLFITDGVPYTGHPPVGALTDGTSLCTATLVGKCTVITAAHCVTPNAQHYFVLGDQSYPASDATRHPDYGQQGGHDVAVVLLKTAPQIAPGAIAVKPPQVGQQVTLIGYGASSWNGDLNSPPIGAGVRRMATNTVAAISDTRIGIYGSGNGNGNLCFGDSGGPTFATIDGIEVQVGIHSTIAAACGIEGHDMRVDVYADWLEQTAGSCGINRGEPDTEPPVVTLVEPQDGATVAPSLTVIAEATDNVGVTLVELLVDGAPATQAEAAPYRLAVELGAGAHRLTVQAHDEAGNVGQAEVQVQVEEPEPEPEPELGAFADDCDGPQDCQSGLCVADLAQQRRFCTRACSLANQNCPAGALCVEAAGGVQVCKLEPPDHGGLLEARDDAFLIGGCSTAGATNPPAPGLLLLGLLLLRRGRRRLAEARPSVAFLVRHRPAPHHDLVSTQTRSRTMKLLAIRIQREKATDRARPPSAELASILSPSGIHEELSRRLQSSR